MTDEVLLNPSEEAGQVPEDFVGQVRDALTHLYDHAHLQRHPLARLAGEGGPQTRAKALRNLLLDALEQLNPGDGVSRNAREWRPYDILMRRYVDGYTPEEIIKELHTSLRQLQRDHRRGVLAIASILWERWQGIEERAMEPAEEGESLSQEIAHLGLALAPVELAALVESAIAPARTLTQAAAQPGA